MRTTIDRVGKYELRAVLARTPMSTVYDGWDSDIARRVAVKLMPLSTVDDAEASEAFARFKRGAQAAGQLNHPNIVAVYDYGETDDYAYLVMEFVNGPTLKSLFDENQRFALPEICKIIGAVLDALQYSHDRGVVHRDVKPANIMFTAEKQVKITDFGIARLEDSEMTQAGMVIGTPAYMSPEQFLGEKIDARTDVYSTGVVLYHILTGERPYEGNLATIMHKVLYGSPLLPSRVSTLVTPAIDAVVTRAMARNREDRFGSAAEFNAALQAAAVAAPAGPAVATGRPPRTQPRPVGAVLSKPGASKMALGGVAVLLAVVAAGGYAMFKPSRSPSPSPVPSGSSQAQAVAVPAPLTQEEWRRQQDEELQRQQQASEEDRRQQALAAARQQEQDRQLQEEQVRILQQQQQARLLQEQEQARAEEQREQARIQQQQEQARLQQQEQARLQQQEQARQKQEQEQARIKAAQEQARQNAAQDRARQKLVLETTKPKPPPEPASHKPEPPTAVAANVLPTLYPVTSTSGAAGLVCVTVTPDNAREYGLDTPQGMAVTGVLAGGAADRAGLRPRDVILKIKGIEARDLSALSASAADGASAQPVQIDIVRSGTHKVLQLQFTQQRG